MMNNQRQLSIDAGVIIRSMHSDCNVSFSKMPLSIHLCLTLLVLSVKSNFVCTVTHSDEIAAASE